MQIFDKLESQVRFYSRDFATTFDKAQGPFLYNTQGVRYLDFFCGAGALSYGHNEPRLKRAVMRYLKVCPSSREADRVTPEGTPDEHRQDQLSGHPYRGPRLRDRRDRGDAGADRQ
jgi:hypothetical protein